MAKLKRKLRQPVRSSEEQARRDKKAKTTKMWRGAAARHGMRIPPHKGSPMEAKWKVMREPDYIAKRKKRK